jgi:hypothetical protein
MLLWFAAHIFHSEMLTPGSFKPWRLVSDSFWNIWKSSPVRMELKMCGYLTGLVEVLTSCELVLLFSHQTALGTLRAKVPLSRIFTITLTSHPGLCFVDPWIFNYLTPEINPSAQRCLKRFFTGDFASWTVHFVNICVKSQQIHQLFIQFINYVW